MFKHLDDINNWDFRNATRITLIDEATKKTSELWIDDDSILIGANGSTSDTFLLPTPNDQPVYRIPRALLNVAPDEAVPERARRIFDAIRYTLEDHFDTETTIEVGTRLVTKILEAESLHFDSKRMELNLLVEFAKPTTRPDVVTMPVEDLVDGLNVYVEGYEMVVTNFHEAGKKKDTGEAIYRFNGVCTTSDRNNNIRNTSFNGGVYGAKLGVIYSVLADSLSAIDSLAPWYAESPSKTRIRESETHCYICDASTVEAAARIIAAHNANVVVESVPEFTSADVAEVKPVAGPVPNTIALPNRIVKATGTGICPACRKTDLLYPTTVGNFRLVCRDCFGVEAPEESEHRTSFDRERDIDTERDAAIEREEEN